VSILDLLQRPIAFHRPLAEVAGSCNGGVFLSQALYWSRRSSLEDGWFYKTSDEWFEETCLSRREQETVRKHLVSIGVLEEERRGVPAKLHFRLNTHVLERELERAVEEGIARQAAATTNGVQSSLAENAKLVSTKAPNKNGGNRQSITETTAETTTETKTLSAAAELDAEFEEFWAAYPKRPGNPKHPAKLKYQNARRRLLVSRLTILEAAKAYATSRKGEDPKFTQQAVTWLNQRRWEEYADAPSPAGGSDKAIDVSPLAAVYPTSPGDLDEVRAAVAASGGSLDQITEAARKFALLVKAERAEGFTRPIPALAQFVRFRWRDMDAYEFCRIGMNNTLTVRPRKGTRT
jgi:hypothetical protein